MRTFISLNPGKETIKSIHEIQQEVRSKISEINKEFLNSVKWEAEDKFHITLFFIGEIDEAGVNKVHLKLQQIVSEVEIHEMIFKAKGINAFPKLRSPRVIIIELENFDGNVFRLSEKINAKLIESGFHSEKKFLPHVTIGRIKRDRKLNLGDLEKMIMPELKFGVKEFCLMKSELKSSGSEYSVLKKYDLK